MVTGKKEVRGTEAGGWAGGWASGRIRVRGKEEGNVAALVVTLVEDSGGGLCDRAGKVREQKAFWRWVGRMGNMMKNNLKESVGKAPLIPRSKKISLS